MNPRINQLVKSLLKKDTLEQCSLPELEQFAERHPYFGAAQLLLTKKMQTGDPEKYDEQLQKTFLFFHNPLWVEHLLNETGNAEIIRIKKEDSAPKQSVGFSAATATVEKEPEMVEPVKVITGGGVPEPATVFTISETGGITATETQQDEITALKTVSVKDEWLFEPFHTIDYFASQGINFKEEENPKDKFGQQLKSFTEWLKTMKRLPATEIAKTSEPEAEKKVEEMAEHSLEDRDVLTEAMAEVWEKQGNSLKAIEIYSKLSLHEPLKNAYFAAKIENLKKLI